jgi:hypothetical protein
MRDHGIVEWKGIEVGTEDFAKNQRKKTVGVVVAVRRTWLIL